MSNSFAVSNTKDPFMLLLTIEEQCKKNARPLPGQQDLARTWQGIGFIAANQHFVVPLNEIKEVLTVPMVTPLPSAAHWFIGFANLRGRLLPITDLAGFVNGVRQSLSPLSRIVVVNFEQSEVGFLVQEVLGVQRFAQSTLKKIDRPITAETLLDIDPKFIPYLQGEFSDELTHWHVLSLQAMSQMSQFYHVVKESEA